MRNEDYFLLRGVTWFVCVYHVVLGIVMNCPVGWIEWTVSLLLGATKMPDASALFLARMLGTYVLMIGIAAGLAAWDPIKNRAMLSVLVILTVLRSVQRLLQASDLEVALGVAAKSNWTMVAVSMGFAATLAYFRYRIYMDMRST
jgi:hypothetical protein